MHFPPPAQGPRVSPNPSPVSRYFDFFPFRAKKTTQSKKAFLGKDSKKSTTLQPWAVMAKFCALPPQLEGRFGKKRTPGTDQGPGGGDHKGGAQEHCDTLFLRRRFFLTWGFPARVAKHFFRETSVNGGRRSGTPWAPPVVTAPRAVPCAKCTWPQKKSAHVHFFENRFLSASKKSVIMGQKLLGVVLS